MKPIVTLTLNPSIDESSEAEVVRPIRKTRTHNQRYDPGGGGINVARVASELGAPACAIYFAGGATGSLLDALLRGRGFEPKRIDIAGNTRISHMIFETSTGLEYRFVPEGPEILEHECKTCLAALDRMSFDFLVASGSLPRQIAPTFYVRVGEIARRKGAKFILDTSGLALEKTLSAGGVYLAKPSLGEFEHIVGRSLADERAQEEAALELVKRGAVSLLAVTLGRDGAFLASERGIRRIAAMPVEARSAVGAGDSFVAGMTVGLAQGMEIEEAFIYGMAAGTAAVLTPGTELCRRADVERLFAELKAREG